MKLKSQRVAFCLAIPMALGLSACGGGNDSANKGGDATAQASSTGAPAATGSTSDNSASGSIPTLAQGPDVCFRAVAQHLGADVKVSEILSFFSVGNEIDGSDTKPAGEMTTCSVQYQNPQDPRKLLSTRMNMQTGQFEPPSPVEIRVTGGNAATFNLEDYLIPLSSVDASALTSVMDAQKASLQGVYSRYAWSGVRLSEPGPFSDTHTLRLDIKGRLASNDIKNDGYASVSLDGKTITTNHLQP